MADLITLAEAKAHLRLDPDDTSEDGQLTLLIRAAHAMIARRLGTPIVGDPGRWATGADVPADLPVAALMIVAELYINRDANIGSMPTVEMLVGDYARVAFA